MPLTWNDRLFASLAVIVIVGFVATVTTLTMETLTNRAKTLEVMAVSQGNSDKLVELKRMQEIDAMETELLKSKIELLLSELKAAKKGR